VARYFFRLNYPARDLRLAIVEASEGKIGSPIDAIALMCFHYNPVTGKYGLAVLGVVRLASVCMVVGLCVGIGLMIGWDRVARRRAGGPAVESGA
jgi:protein SCO1/2